MKKKILHIIPAFELGGVQTGILYSIEKLNEIYDYKVLVIGKVDEEWVRGLSFPLQNYLITIGASVLLPGWVRGYKTVKQLKPDLIISSLWKSVGLSAPFKFFNKNVVLCGFFHNASSPHLVSSLLSKLISFVQDAAIADSYATKTFLKEFYNIKNADVVPYFFDFNLKKEKKSFDPSYVKLAYFGRINRNKGANRSIELCSLLKHYGINFIFDIYGDGPVDLYSQIIKDAGLAGCVCLKEKLPLHLVGESMKDYDFLLQLSNHEGMALSVVEAMNAGLVPLVTPVGEMERYTKDMENALWLNKPFDDNLDKLAQKVKEVIDSPDLYYKLSLSASKTFEGHKKYTDALVEVINKHLK
jgi:glycosyltransferase involved in cell wall biosynthesis